MVGKQRNFGLDVMRAVSILLVLVAHAYSLNYELGIVGVQIFFVLSGFLIGQILIKEFSKEINSDVIFNFWKRRWFRTLPMYYLILILKIIIYGNPYGWKMIVYFFFFQANFVGIDFFGVSWSLVVEEWFYLFLPLGTFVFFRKRIEYKRFFYFLLFSILFFFTARFLWNFFHKGIILYQFDCLLLGVVLALIKLNSKKLYNSLASIYCFITGLIGIIYLTIILGSMENISVYNPFYRVAWYFIISIFIFLTIPFMEKSTFINNKLKQNASAYYFFTWTSVLTYSIYLIHMEVFKINFDSHLLTRVVQLIVLYGFSFLFYALYEHPMINLRDKLSFKHYTDSIKSFSLNVIGK